MKFNCGPTAVERYEQKCIKKKSWQPFFAIWPRRVGPNDCRWLETIYRKGTLLSWYDGVYWQWQYEYRSSEDHAIWKDSNA